MQQGRKYVTSERGFDDADSGREGKPDTEKPKGQLPSYHLTTTANPLRTQPHSQSESVHNSGGTNFPGPVTRPALCVEVTPSTLNVVDYRYRFHRNFSELVNEVLRDLVALLFALLMQIRDE